MTQDQTMTVEEKLAISNKAIALTKSGALEGYDRLMKTIPLPRIWQEQPKKIGPELFIRTGWDLSEA